MKILWACALLVTACGSDPGPVTDGGTADAVAEEDAAAGAVDAAPPDVASFNLRIMPLGDSITLGVNGGYRDGLYTRLTGAGYTVDYVGSQSDQYTGVADHDHEGHPGFTIGGIADEIDGWLTTYQPTHVLLMIGTNDVAWWCAMTAAEVADTHAALVDTLLASGATVLVASIPPLTSGNIEPNDVDRATLGAAYSAELRSRIAARVAAGQDIAFVDVEAVLTTADLYDGVHPTEEAHDKIAQVWFDALVP
jgi:lysophospholipase L1-like esterase